jgi:hypothetical protein
MHHFDAEAGAFPVSKKKLRSGFLVGSIFLRKNWVVVSNHRILDSSRFLIQEFILAEILYGSIEKVKIQSIKISSNMVYTNIFKNNNKENLWVQIS